MNAIACAIVLGSTMIYKALETNPSNLKTIAHAIWSFGWFLALLISMAPR